MTESILDQTERRAAQSIAKNWICPCGKPIVRIDYDTSRGIRWERRDYRAPLAFECYGGHTVEYWVTSRVANSIFRKVA